MTPEIIALAYTLAIEQIIAAMVKDGLNFEVVPSWQLKRAAMILVNENPKFIAEAQGRSQ